MERREFNKKEFSRWFQELEKIAKVEYRIGNLDKKDFELLSAFGRGLGTTDSEGQIINCERHSRLIGENIETAKKDAEVKGKLYSALGVIGGIFLVILFL